VVECAEADGSVTFRVRVAPRASRSAAAGEHDGALKVRVAAPPVEGAANDELVRFLARSLGLAPRDVEIISGHTSRTKLVRARGATAAQVRRLSQQA
jgi:uncharacterized protein (TIGR00251 family)